MKENGAIICFQKYTTEYRNYNTDEHDGPVCLGYFNSVEVQGIETFRNYIYKASKYQAERACSRKQLLLWKRISPEKVQDEEPTESLDAEIIIRPSKSGRNGKIPFCSSIPSEEFSLGCCSVFNIRDGECRKNEIGQNRCLTREKLEYELYNQIKAIQHDGNFRFAIMESLGTEDLCLIVLTNHYDNISNIIKVVQRFSCGNGAQTDSCGSKCIIDNGHSILMIDRNCPPEKDMWGITQASIHFSLRSAAGLHYLRSVERTLNASGDLREGERITLDGCSGEYDAIMRCPARLVMDKLFGDSGYFGPASKEYQRSVYQSETFVYPIGMDDTPEAPEDLPVQKDEHVQSELNRVVDEAINQLRELFHYAQDDPDFDYIELPICRLLKDYWSFAAFPLNKDLREDLKIQLIASVNAIVEEARRCTKTNRIDIFMQSFDKIVDAMRANMQAGSQQDRWNFGEQKSYIQNVDSYYKILHCYYGIVKDLIKLIYHIERTDDQDQPLLIPLLSFGVKSIIKSNRYASTVRSHPANLICIRLPYQALANLPRYLGPLAHELFHYSAPAKRTARNEWMIKTLLRVSLTEFISVLAVSQNYPDGGDYWTRFFCGLDGCRGIVDADEIVALMYVNLRDRLAANGRKITSLKLDEIKGIVLPQCLNFSNSRYHNGPYRFYYSMWKNIRNIVRKHMTTETAGMVDQETRQRWMKMFALSPEQKDADLTMHYRVIMDAVDMNRVQYFRNLLHSTIMAMEECPADIFNLEVVMAGKDAGKKIGQYLWQINGAKRDETLMRTIDRNNRDEWPFVNSRRGVLANQIRNAMIIHYYLASQEKGGISDVLGDWAPEEGRYKESLGNVKQGFIKDYQDVMARFHGLLEDNNRICHGIAVRVRNLLSDNVCSRIMQRLSRMYERYYTLLEQRQRCMFTNGEMDYQDELFRLCCELIDAYQSQSALDTTSITSTALVRGQDQAPQETKCSGIVVCNSAELSSCVRQVIDWLMIRNQVPDLWFCGDFRLRNVSPSDIVLSLHSTTERYDALRFSAGLHSEILHATADWPAIEGEAPEKNAAIMVLNPLLFNLAMELLEDGQDACLNLRRYLEAEVLPSADTLPSGWQGTTPYPRAVGCTDAQNRNAGYVCCGTVAPGNTMYSLEWIQTMYKKKFLALQKDATHGHILKDLPFIPFLSRIELNHLQYVDFKNYIRAIGVRY